MKLHNNETGEIKAVNHAKILVHFSDGTTDAFNSIKQLTDKYSDYSEPLIKDEKIRKAVRAWAEANNYFEILYDKDKDCLHSPYGSDDTDTSVSISFDDIHVLENLEHRKLYTIAELCGEEEE